MRNRQRNRLERILQPHPVPGADPGRIAETLSRSQELLADRLRRGGQPRSTFRQFYLAQLRFVGRRTWALHALILVFAGALMQRLPESIASDRLQLIALLSAAAPLLVLAGLRTLAQSSACGMMELEASTYYSLDRLLLARFSLLGAVDAFGLALLAGLFSASGGQEFARMLLYLFTPFTLASSGALWLQNRSRSLDRGLSAQLYLACFAAFQAAAAVSSPEPGHLLARFYGAAAAPVWLLVLALSLAALARQINRLLRSCRTREINL